MLTFMALHRRKQPRTLLSSPAGYHSLPLLVPLFEEADRNVGILGRYNKTTNNPSQSSLLHHHIPISATSTVVNLRRRFHLDSCRRTLSRSRSRSTAGSLLLPLCEHKHPEPTANENKSDLASVRCVASEPSHDLELAKGWRESKKERRNSLSIQIEIVLPPHNLRHLHSPRRVEPRCSSCDQG